MYYIQYFFIYSNDPITVNVQLTFSGNESGSLGQQSWTVIRQEAPNVVYNDQNLQVVGDLLIDHYTDMQTLRENITHVESSTGWAVTASLEITSTPFLTSSSYMGEHGK